MSPKKDRIPDLGERIAAYRAAADLTMEGLAVRIGTRKATLGHWEEGIREPNLVMLCRLADVFRCSTDRLLGHKARPRRPRPPA